MFQINPFFGSALADTFEGINQRKRMKRDKNDELAMLRAQMAEQNQIGQMAAMPTPEINPFDVAQSDGVMIDPKYQQIAPYLGNGMVA
jgi:hypothetical protein